MANGMGGHWTNWPRWHGPLQHEAREEFAQGVAGGGAGDEEQGLIELSPTAPDSISCGGRFVIVVRAQGATRRASYVIMELTSPRLPEGEGYVMCHKTRPRTDARVRVEGSE